MNQRLSEQQINNILPLLSAIANDVAKGLVPDRQWLGKRLLSASKGSADGVALQELGLWSDILRQVRTRVLPEASVIQLLQDRGLAQAPATLAVNIASGPPVIMQEVTIADAEVVQSEYKQKQERLGILIEMGETASAKKDYQTAAQLQEEILQLRNELELGILNPTESYHEWLPDHKWHNDLDWEHVPPFIRRNHKLMDMLLQGKEVNSKNVSYEIMNGRLMRKLHDECPTVRLEAPREEYHDWLADHKWHDDLNYDHLPLWIKRDTRLFNSLPILGTQINGKYVLYKVVGNRLMRRLKDAVPVMTPEKHSR